MSKVNKLPFIDRAFKRLTAVRFASTPAVAATAVTPAVASSLSVNFEENDVVHASIWQGGKPTGKKRLDPWVLNPGDPDQIFTVAIAKQGLVAIAEPVWVGVECFAPVLLALGSFCPLDETSPDGITPINRELYWQPLPAKPPAPETELSFTLTAAGLLSWTHRGVSHSLSLKAGGELHLILLLRDTDTGRFTIPAFRAQPVTELQL